jgi:O-antigen/teichoic acid export membrane protein
LNLTKKIFTGSALQTANIMFDILIGFFMMPFLINGLGEKWYGLWLLVGSVMGFFGLLTIGLSGAVQRYLSIESSPDKIKEYNSTLNSALAVFAFTSMIAILLSYVISLMPSLFISDIELSEAFSSIMLLMGFNIAISFISSPFRAVLLTNYQFAIVSASELTSILAKASLTFCFITLGYSVISIAFATLVSTTLCALIIIITSLKQIKKIRFGRSYIKKAKLFQLFSFGAKTFIAWIGDILRFSIDNMVITAFVGLSSVTIYNIPIRLLNYASQFIVTSLGVLQPLFSQLAGENNNEDVKNKFELAYGVSFAMSGLLSSGLFVFGYDFISLWVGEYKEVEQLMYIIPLMMLFATSQNPCILILYSHNKHQYYAYQNIGEGILNLCISLIAVQYWGILGVALGTFIPTVITKLFLQPQITCSVIDYSLSKYYKQMIACFVFVIIFSLISLNLKGDIDNWGTLLVNIIIFTCVFIPSYWVTSLNKNTKAFFTSKLIKS